MAFKGASVGDANGAGIRHQGTHLTVRDCLFVDNQDGILGSPLQDGTGSVTILGSEFDHNGAGDGYSHNLYLGHYASVVFRSSYSHLGNVGHLFKSRAARNEILFSRLTDESGGAASYEIDLPNGGESWIVGSVVEQVGSTQNSAILAFGEEGLSGPDDLHIVNSTFVNHHSKGTFLSVGGSVGTPVQVVNSLLMGPGTLSTQASTSFVSSWDDSMGDPLLVDATTLDLHLQSTSPLLDAGTTPPAGVQPDAEYVHPTGEQPRSMVGSAWDIGAYEYGNTGAVDTGGDDTGTVDSGPIDTADSGSAESVDSDSPTDESQKSDACGCSAHAEAPPLLGLLGVLMLLRRRRS
jgi:MYXO-CTERM domain-containing protein